MVFLLQRLGWSNWLLSCWRPWFHWWHLLWILHWLLLLVLFMCHVKRKNVVLVLMAISMIIVSLLMIIFPVMGMETVAIWVLMEVVMIPIPESCM